MHKQKVSFGDLSGWKNYHKYRVLIHVLVWVLYTFAYAYIYAALYTSATLGSALFQYGTSAWIDVTAAYLLIYYLIPVFLLQKDYKGFILRFVLSAIVFVMLQRVVTSIVVYQYIYPGEAENFSFFKFNYLYSFLNIYVMPVIFASIKLFEYWFVYQKQNQELQKEKIESELKFLKSQIHPHFLFNTLNNLYALTLDKSEKAPDVVVRLSDLLSYMLYECNAPFVSLEKEIRLLNDYLALEKIRYPAQLKVGLDVNGRIADKQIPPLLLLPFVENAFKHGLSQNINKPWVNITLDVEDYLLIFCVENNKPVHAQTNKPGYTKGIGLENVQRRLDLIYKDNYSLEVKNQETVFSVRLKMELKSGHQHLIH